MPPRGLLYVPAEAGPSVTEDEFNDWYDNEHVPARMALPTFHATTRWTAADNKQPTYLAVYDIESCDVLVQPSYSTLASSASERERDVVSRVQLLERRTYDRIDVELYPPVEGYDARAPGPFLVSAMYEIKPELEEDFHKWYREEHVDLLSKVPGWRRSRRYVLREAGPNKGSDAEKVAERGRPPKHLAIHEWQSLECFQTPQFKHATTTPWRMRLFESADVWEARIHKLLKAWTRE